jgi:cytoskeletal protein CcmA (bactofilin family)
MLGSRKSDSSSSTASLGGISIPSYPSSPSSGDSAHSLVDKHLVMRGDLESEGDVLVRGKVIGNIKCRMLIVDTDAEVDGGVVANEVIMRGKAKGNIKAQRVKLENTAHVDCEIAHRVFSAEEGARIKGTLRILEEGESDSGKDGLALVA